MPKQGTASIPARLRALDRAQRASRRAGNVVSDRPPRQPGRFRVDERRKGYCVRHFGGHHKIPEHETGTRVSLLIDSRMNSSRDHQETEVMTIFGKAQEVQKGPRRTELARLLVGKHPEFASFVAAPSTALIRVAI